MFAVDGEALERMPLRDLLALRERVEARVAVAIGEFDRDGLWDLDHDVSMRKWLEHQAGMSPATAGRYVKTGKRLCRYPALAAAWSEGRLTGGQVDAIVAVLTDRRLPIFDDHCDTVLAEIEPLDVAQTTVVMRRWAELADNLVPAPPPGEPDDTLHHSETLDGRSELKGSFTPEGRALLDAALGLAAQPDDPDRPRQLSRRRAGAMLDIARFFLDHHDATTTAPRHRPHLLLVWTQDRFDAGLGATLHDGTPLDRVTSERLLCDCSIARLVLDRRGQILDLGLTVRNPPRAMRDALIARDRGCRWPGCARPVRHCDAHHAIWFTRGGRTAVSNMVLLCIRHHHKLHGPGWSAVLDPDTAELTITTPDGRTLRSKPPPPTALPAAA